jgi:hypothetical protein
MDFHFDREKPYRKSEMERTRRCELVHEEATNACSLIQVPAIDDSSSSESGLWSKG